jgi:hypothetical protein
MQSAKSRDEKRSAAIAEVRKVIFFMVGLLFCQNVAPEGLFSAMPGVSGLLYQPAENEVTGGSVAHAL